MRQDDGQLRQIRGLAVEEPETGNVGGLEVHRISFSSVGSPIPIEVAVSQMHSQLAESVNVAVLFLRNSCHARRLLSR